MFLQGAWLFCFVRGRRDTVAEVFSRRKGKAWQDPRPIGGVRGGIEVPGAMNGNWSGKVTGPPRICNIQGRCWEGENEM